MRCGRLDLFWGGNQKLVLFPWWSFRRVPEVVAAAIPGGLMADGTVTGAPATCGGCGVPPCSGATKCGNKEAVEC